MKKKRELALAVISMLLIAFALSACSHDSSGSVSPHEDAWLQAYYDVQNSRRRSRAYQAIDYTRSLYFDGHATIEQTQQRIYLILEATPALRLSPIQTSRYIAIATDLRPYYRNLSARDIYRRYIR